MAVDTALVSLDDVTIIAADGGATIVQDAAFRLRRGESLGIAGESGSGKTALVHALLGYARQGLRFTSGTVAIWDGSGIRSLKLTGGDFGPVRGDRVAIVPQAASSVLDPIMVVGAQLREVAAAADRSGDPAEQVLEALREVGFTNPDDIVRRYPHQLSGGQRQRINLSMALIGRPEILVLDEATTDLDAITQRKVLDVIKKLKADHELTLVAVSHDLRVLADLCDDLIVMRAGEIVEQGPIGRVLDAPEHEYTASLVQRFKHGPLADSEFDGRVDTDETAEPILRIDGLTARHKSTKGGRTRTIEVLHAVSLNVQPGEAVGIVGESGSGKTTLARALIGIHRDWSGTARFRGEQLASTARRRDVEVRRALQIVLQNPDSTFNPRLTIGESIARRLRKFEGIRGKAARDRIVQLLGEVGLRPEHADRYSGELSGGQRQRASIARSLVGDPELLICDEIVSGLDVESQARVIQLLTRLRIERQLTLVFISHDISVVGALTQKTAVFRHGSMVDWGPTQEVIENPRTEYTRELVNAAYISHSTP
jgi:peptide/nickel transport system ATP-binding protein